MTRNIYAFIALTAFVASPVLAQTLVDDLDADGSGGLSLAELQLAYPAADEDNFGLIDMDGDGEANPAEVTAAVEAGLLVTSG